MSATDSAFPSGSMARKATAATAALRAKKGSFSSQGRGARQPAGAPRRRGGEAAGAGGGGGRGGGGGLGGARGGGAGEGLEVAEQGQHVEEPGDDVAAFGRPRDGFNPKRVDREEQG